jgi:hypothetical protein
VDIRSYRPVFHLERRIYRVDRVRLNPSGVPVRGVVWFLALLVAVALVGASPLLGAPLRALPWYVRELATPGAVAALLTVLRIEGRPSHLAARALLAHLLAPRHVHGSGGARAPRRSWRPGELLLLPDGSEAAMRRLRYAGPGAVLVCVPHRRVEWRDGHLGRLLRRPQLTLRPVAGPPLRRPQVIEMAEGGRLRVGARSGRR